MEFVIKTFDELNTEELFDIYKLRVAVFVVEQNCPYQEVDDNDRVSIHVMLKEGNDILAYLRVLPPGAVFDDAAIGRVIAARRREGLGTLLVEKGIAVAKERFHAPSITIEAQTYAREFYEKIGFVQISEKFLEDGIPHIGMRYVFPKDGPDDVSVI